MIGLDTNVLVRFLVTSSDAPEQSAQVRALVLAALEQGEQIYIASTVLVELVWVLRQVGKQPKEIIVRQLDGLLAARGFVVGSRVEVHAALTRWQTRGGDFADYFIAEQARSASVGLIFTFDRALLGREGFRSPAEGL